MGWLAFANPEDITDEKKRSDGYGIARFNKKSRTITFECWPRFSDVRMGDKAQFPGWPIKVAMDANDGRKVVGYLPEIVFEEGVNGVVQVVEEKTGEVLYTVRTQGGTFSPRVYAEGKYTVKVGKDKPDAQTVKELEPMPASNTGQKKIKITL